ncbi:glycoside hydrolase family 2 TIM barrel-domain containing protein [Paenibacillus donghaensis]|uniref:Beta-glucuronidase n=1 Tax=Paenibacillus donghaensis TaxID=414771 RepID=A0A2Z2KJW9_9BACL|nr:glycoside hydrolase family 2 TIM barrel-domain containing protein [Paenibacillus donghaensis]ASA26307.1 beta-glucuronidase [Paenibacillus donghaensis]
MISLEGEWKLQLDMGKQGLLLPYSDVITLPGTTSHARKGPMNEEVLVSALTDEYRFEGHAWYSKEIVIPEELAGTTCYLYLERTRLTTLWLDGQEVGSRNSLNTAHIYELTGKLRAGTQTLTIRVDNTDYPTKGGHLTSPDTQTNWNGITGRIELQFYSESYLSGIWLEPDLSARSVRITATLEGTADGTFAVSASSFNSLTPHSVPEREFTISPGEFTIDYQLDMDALLWSETAPNLYNISLVLKDREGETVDRNEQVFGLSEFKTDGDKFTINGEKTFLRGKHDGLIFPLTGYAPTDVEEWLRILGISKSYGINHYRFHTCCPPEAAFTAADMLGIYMEPELPFWGTITEPTDEGHNQAEQDYLVSEGYAILQAFGNHPSFVMMSLGNELWGSRTKIDSILRDYKAFDDRHLYTQGSNNHQWVPEVLEHEDFFCGVRFSRERLFRGSYAMCDAPLGHVQTDLPGTMKDYDDQIVPPELQNENSVDAEAGGTIQIQYGTEAKTVQLGGTSGEWIPKIPVISHEIGQYATYPNYEEIGKYNGPLQAENFKIFRERLESNGLGHLAAQYFESSGQLAVACYKEELEAAFRSRRLAGFQLLDLQDFSGQGTALVGILDAFMDSKGMITPEEWRTFCSDAVLMARFPKYNYVAGERFSASVELSWFRSGTPGTLELHWELTAPGGILAEGTAEADVPAGTNYIDICQLAIDLPAVGSMTQAALNLKIAGTDIRKSYDLWIYPEKSGAGLGGIRVFEELSDEAFVLLEQGENVLLMPKPESLHNAVEGFYSTDFWCYPMFRSISESMNKPVPVGTMGLLIDNSHPVFRDFPCEQHSTYPWWSIIQNSKSIILDGTSREWSPIVQTIDNFERNHKLGFLFECRVGAGKLLVCALDAGKAGETPEGKQFLSSLAGYMTSKEFKPQVEASRAELLQLIQ